MTREEAIDTMKHWFSDMLETGKERNSIDDVLNSLPSVTPAPKKCHNVNSDYAECDQFVCSNCGIELQDWHRVERDEDDGNVTYH